MILFIQKVISQRSNCNISHTLPTTTIVQVSKGQPVNYAIIPYTTDSTCLYNSFVYEASIENITSFVSFNNSTNVFTFNSLRYSEEGTYKIGVTATLQNNQTDYHEFNLFIECPCATAIWNHPFISPILYVLNDPEMYYELPPLSMNDTDCVEFENYEIFQFKGGIFDLKLDSQFEHLIDPKILWMYTTDSTQIGNYSFKLGYKPRYGAVNTGSIKFQVQILHPCESPLINYAPAVGLPDYYLNTVNAPSNENIFQLDWIKPQSQNCLAPIKYSFSSSPPLDANTIIIIDSTNTISIQSLIAQTTLYTVTISGEVDGYPLSAASNSLAIYLENLALPQSCSVIKTFAHPIPSPQVYKIGSPPFEIKISDWLETSIQSPSQCQVTLQEPVFIVPSTAISIETDFLATPPTLQYHSNNLANDQITVEAEIKVNLLDTSSNQQVVSQPYIVNVLFKSPCQPPFTKVVLRPGQIQIPQPIIYYITDPSLTIQLPIYEASPADPLCPSSIIEYSLTTRYGGATPSFVTDRVNKLSIYSTDDQLPSIQWDFVYRAKFGAALFSYSDYFSIQMRRDCARNKIVRPTGGFNVEARIGFEAMVDISAYTTQVRWSTEVEGQYCPSLVYYQCFIGWASCPINIYTVNNADKKLAIFTNDMSLAGAVRQLTVKASLIINTFPAVVDKVGITIFVNFTSTLCENAQLIPHPIPYLIYDISTGSKLIISTLEWGKSDIKCPNISYSLTDLDTAGPLDSIFSINSLNQLQIQTTDTHKVRTYRIKITGHRGEATKDLEFSLRVTDACDTAKITAPFIPDIKYDLSDGNPLVISFEDFKASHSYCATFTYSLTRRDGSANLHSFIKFDPSLKSIAVKAQSAQEVGSYQYLLTGKLPSKQVSITVTVVIEFKCADDKMVPAIIEDDFYRIGSGQKKMNVHSWTQTIKGCGDSQYSIQVNESSDLPNFITFDKLTRDIKIQTSDKTLDGMYFKIKVKGSLLSTNEAHTTTFQLSLIYISEEDVIFSSILDSLVDSGNNLTLRGAQLQGNQKSRRVVVKATIEAIISDIDFNQTVTIRFNRNMQIPKDLSIFAKSKALAMSFIEGPTGHPIPDMIKGWKLVSFQEDTMVIKLFIDDPSSISLSRDYDTLRITFKLNKMFMNALKDQMLPRAYTIRKPIPPQLKETKGTLILQSVVNLAAKTISGALSTNFVLAFFLGVSLRKVWQLMNTLQILVLIPLMSVTLPANVIYMSQTLIELTKFNIIPKDKIKRYLKNIFMQTNDEGFGYNSTLMGSNFQTMGYESSDLLDNMGMLVLFMVALSIFAVTLLAILKYLAARFALIQKLYDKLHQKIFFNSFLRSIQKGYLAFCLAIMISLEKAKDDAKQKAISSVIAAFLLSLPIFAAIFFRKYIHRFSDEDFKLRYGSLYLNLKENSLVAMGHTILYFVRRLIYAAIIVFAGDYPSLQNIIFVLSSLALLSFQFHVLPMSNKSSQYMELFNELTIMTIGCLLTPFSSDSFDLTTSDVSYNYGWMIIVMTLANIGLNQMVMIVSVGSKVYKLIKKGVKWIKGKTSKNTAAIKPTTNQEHSFDVPINAQPQFCDETVIQENSRRSGMKDQSEQVKKDKKEVLSRVSQTSRRPESLQKIQNDQEQHRVNFLKEFDETNEQPAQNEQDCKVESASQDVEQARNQLQILKANYLGNRKLITYM